MDFTEGLRDADTESLLHGPSRGIVIPGEPVLGGELFQRQSNHLRITGAVARLLPDNAQSSQDLIVVDIGAGGADNANWAILHCIVYPDAGADWERNSSQFSRPRPHFNGVGFDGADIGNSEPLIHGCSSIVIPGELVFTGKLLFGQSHHF